MMMNKVSISPFLNSKNTTFDKDITATPRLMSRHNKNSSIANKFRINKK